MAGLGAFVLVRSLYDQDQGEEVMTDKPKFDLSVTPEQG